MVLLVRTTSPVSVYESVAAERNVYVTSDNRIGTLASPRRYKDEIRPMEDASKAIHSLRPVRFRYKKEVDPTRSLCFGLIAEEVAKIDPDLVTPGSKVNRDRCDTKLSMRCCSMSS
jgi:hypothetical protein